MSRVATGDVVVVKPTNNIYTVLVGIAILAQAIGFLVLYLRASEIFEAGKGLFAQ
jgi:hypothetical protein